MPWVLPPYRPVLLVQRPVRGAGAQAYAADPAFGGAEVEAVAPPGQDLAARSGQGQRLAFPGQFRRRRAQQRAGLFQQRAEQDAEHQVAEIGQRLAPCGQLGEDLAGARPLAVADDLQGQPFAQRQAVAQGRQFMQLPTQRRPQQR